MSYSQRFHLAARDGKLDVLKETTRKDCNTKDDDGMTPTLWAAFEGNLEALRLLVGRGGDPEKCDHYGNTGLHFAAARGHMNCVTFLMNYGVNLYAKDIDYHTAKELAAMNDHQDILRYLDEQAARQQRNDPKKAKAQMEKATKDSEKLVKEFAQVQEKARKMAEKEKKRLEKERQEMERSGLNEPIHVETETSIPRPSLSALELRRDSRLIYSSPKYSDIVNPKEEKDKVKLPVTVSGVYKKVQQQRRKMMTTNQQSQGQRANSISRSTSSTALNNNNGDHATEPGDFKIGVIEDGKRSVRSISGLRKNSEIMYVPKYDDAYDKRTGLDEIFPSANGSRSKSLSGGSGLFSSNYKANTADSGFGDDEQLAYHQQHRASLFERPGMGRIAFRNSITTLLDQQSGVDKPTSANKKVDGKPTEESALDGATRLNHNRRNHKEELDQDNIDSDEEDDNEYQTPLYFFLAGIGLEEFMEPFIKEKFDLDSLMLVNEADLKSMNIPLGHRRKLLKAIHDRKAAIDDSPDEMEDSHL